MDISRSASLIVASDVLTVEQISATMGMLPDRTQAKGARAVRVPLAARRSSWELREIGGSDTSLEGLIETLFNRIYKCKQELILLRMHGCLMTFSLLQCISSVDEYGPGFTLAPDMISLLSDLGAMLDVDQYLED